MMHLCHGLSWSNEHSPDLLNEQCAVSRLCLEVEVVIDIDHVHLDPDIVLHGEVQGPGVPPAAPHTVAAVHMGHLQ